MISKESIEQLKSIIDIVDVVGNYIQLKKAGSNYKALCPFHAEKTPSFVVSPAKQIYHCFGCGASGDAIKFVMEIEKLSYKEAIEKLATFYNFKLEYTKDSFVSFDILEKLNNFYQSELYKNKEAYEYLKRRGLYDSTIEKFKLGYAPGVDEQFKFIKNANLDLKKLKELGAITDKNYPRLIERITFPIFSQSNKIIALGGRTIKNHPAKYINFSNTKIFNKSKTFYGLNFAKEHILRSKEAIIVEGYFDVIMLHQGDIQNTIATLGTSLTKEHLPILQKLQTKVTIAYDSDTAGINAAIKAAKLLYENFFEGGVVLFEEGKDPADMIKEGKDVREYLKNKIEFDTFIIEYSLKKYNLKNPIQKKMAIEEINNYIKELPDILKEDFSLKAGVYLQINPRLFNTKILTSSSNKIDLGEAQIIKTLYENSHFIDAIAEFLSPEMMKYHQEELKALYQEDFENPKLLDIVLRDEIKVLNYEQLKKQITKLLLPLYEKEIALLKLNPKIPTDEKMHKIKQIMQKLLKIKKGDLLEGYITF